MLGLEKPIRVLIVDDHIMVRDSLRLFISTVDDLEFAGEAGNGNEALKCCGESQPDVILMDLIMPVVNGITATRMISAAYPQVKIIALTSMNDEDLVEEILAAGATGALLKNAPIDAIASAIRSAYLGTQVFPKEDFQTRTKIFIDDEKPNKPAPMKGMHMSSALLRIDSSTD